MDPFWAVFLSKTYEEVKMPQPTLKHQANVAKGEFHLLSDFLPGVPGK